MTAKAFSTIALLMSVCIMWGMVLATIFNKKYTKKLQGGSSKDGKKSGIAGFGDLAMTAMFIGLISAYIGSYLGDFASGAGAGLFHFGGSWLPLAVVLVSALAMAGFLWLKEKKKWDWVDNFSIAGSMLVGMVAAVFLGKL